MLVAIFILGLIIGSFLNVVTDGLAQGKKLSVILSRKRSICDHCRRTLSWFELVPVLSFLVLKGRCLKCRKPINWRYTVVELIAGFLVASVFWKGQINFDSPQLIILTSLLVLSLFTLALVDFQSQFVPEGLLQIALFLSLVSLYLQGPSAFLSGFVGMSMAIAIFAPFVFAGRGEIMGEADLLVALIVGIWLGFPAIAVSVITAFITGGLMGLFLIATGIKKRTDTIGFVPYLFIGSIVAYFFGEQIVSWYAGLL